MHIRSSSPRPSHRRFFISSPALSASGFDGSHPQLAVPYGSRFQADCAPSAWVCKNNVEELIICERQNQIPNVIQKLRESTRHERIPNPSQSVLGAGLAGKYERGQVQVYPLRTRTHHPVQCLRILICENQNIAAKESTESFSTLGLHYYPLLQKLPWSHVSGGRSKVQPTISSSD